MVTYKLLLFKELKAVGIATLFRQVVYAPKPISKDSPRLYAKMYRPLAFEVHQEMLRFTALDDCSFSVCRACPLPDFISVSVERFDHSILLFRFAASGFPVIKGGLELFFHSIPPPTRQPSFQPAIPARIRTLLRCW